MFDLKSIIEKNGIIVILTSWVTVATITAGSIGWLWKNTSSIQAEKHSIEIVSIKNKLENKISDLKRRLISIERRVGSNKLYFDISAIPVSSENLPSISRTHKSYADGMFYFNPPKFTTWHEKEASQLDLINPLFGDKITSSEFGQNLINQMSPLSNVKGVLWTSEELVITKLTKKSILRSTYKKKELISKPFVYAMQIDDNFFKNTAQVLSILIEDFNSTSASTNELIKLLETSDENMTDKLIDTAINSKEKVNSKDEKILNLLNNISRGDLAGFFLMDALIRNSNLSRLFGGNMYVVSADKKGNVSYIRLHLKIPNESEVNSSNVQTTIFDIEIFFIGTKKGGILVRSVIPSKEFKTDAYAWSQGLLTSLRVPF